VTVRTTQSADERRTYVLDTSVLLSDPRAIHRFKEHEVVLPVVVISELEGKRHHPELGYFARQALRLLDDLRIKAGRLDAPIPVGDEGGSLHVELNHTDPSSLPAGFRLGDNDTRILAVARNLANEGRRVTIVSKDLPMRVKASACGMDAEEYRAELAVESGWTGMAELDVTTAEMDQLYDVGRLEHVGAAELPCHTGLKLHSPRGSGLGRVGPDKQIRLVRGDRDAFGLHGRSAEMSASSRSVAALARASPRWPCAPASRPCWSVASTARWSSSGPCMPSAAKNWATCRAAKPRR
jgi:PhoH-like ATPase